MAPPEAPGRGGTRPRGGGLARAALVLLALLVAANGLAVFGMVSLRRATDEAALAELRLQSELLARSLEEVVGESRRALVRLSRTPALQELSAAPAGAATAAAEELALGVFGRHPMVEAIALRSGDGAPRLLVGRSGGAAGVLARDHDPPAPIAHPDLFVAQLPVHGPGRARGLLEVWLRPAAALAVLAPDLGATVTLRASAASTPAPQDEPLLIHARVSDPLWSPAFDWVLVRDERQAGLLPAVSALAHRFHVALAIDAAVVALVLGVGLLAFRQVRRAAEVEAAARQRERLQELERQMLHAERLASIGRLAAGVAHEVNNPLEGMANYLSLLREDLAEGRVEEAAGLVAELQRGLERVAGVTRGMLALGEPGRAAAALVDLRQSLREAATLLGAQRELRGIDVVLDLPAEAVPVVGSATTLGQLFLNLLLNAAHSSPASGRVEVRCELRHETAVVEVADRGAGLPPGDPQRLFEPFVSTRGSTGLGLAVCRSIVDGHGGRITALPRTGGGAVFRVELPLGTAPGPGIGAPPEATRWAS